MDVLLVVTTEAAAPLLARLGEALGRKGAVWAAFFTNDGVKSLLDSRVQGALASSARKVACQESWQRHLPNAECPVELGSQTDNSALIAAAQRLVSL